MTIRQSISPIRRSSVFLWLTALLFLALAPERQAQTSMQEAAALLQAKKYAEAERAYQAIVNADPQNGEAWHRLGVALGGQMKFEAAATAYRKSIEIQSYPPSMYNLACTYARLQNRDAAFEWLEKSLTASVAFFDFVLTDPDLETLRTDARFKQIIALIEKRRFPCQSLPVYSQFDFMLGEWEVRAPNSKEIVGHNRFEKILHSCAIVESYTQGASYEGKGLHLFDPYQKRWRQTWTDSSGSVGELFGEYRDGALRYEGYLSESDGKKTMTRGAFFNLGPQQARQVGERSLDGGQTWQVQFELLYTRKP